MIKDDIKTLVEQIPIDYLTPSGDKYTFEYYEDSEANEDGDNHTEPYVVMFPESWERRFNEGGDVLQSSTYQIELQFLKPSKLENRMPQRTFADVSRATWKMDFLIRRSSIFDVTGKTILKPLFNVYDGNLDGLSMIIQGVKYNENYPQCN